MTIEQFEVMKQKSNDKWVKAMGIKTIEEAIGWWFVEGKKECSFCEVFRHCSMCPLVRGKKVPGNTNCMFEWEYLLGMFEKITEDNYYGTWSMALNTFYNKSEKILGKIKRAKYSKRFKGIEV